MTYVQLPPDLIALLERPNLCFLSTLMPDGSPQLTQTWVDTDGVHVLINSVQTHQKVRNIRRDPRVAINICDSAQPNSYVAVRGRVTDLTTDGAVDHIEKLAQRYLGRAYPWWGGRDQVRVLLRITADKITSPRG